MRHVCNHKGVEFYVKHAGPYFVSMLAGIPSLPFDTVLEAEEEARDRIDAGVPVIYRSRISWPNGSPSTERRVDLGSVCGAQQFAEFMFKTISRGGVVTIGLEV